MRRNAPSLGVGSSKPTSKPDQMTLTLDGTLAATKDELSSAVAAEVLSAPL